MSDTSTMSGSLSVSRSGSRTPTLTVPLGITTSVPLQWVGRGDLYFIQRPIRFAAPGVRLPVQPMLLFAYDGGAWDGQPAVHERTYRNNIGINCYVKSNNPRVLVGGSIYVPMVQSLCVFENIVLELSSKYTKPANPTAPTQRA